MTPIIKRQGENEMGFFFAIDGPDGTGKETQSKLLAEALRRMGKKVRVISFPVYESESSSLVRFYLDGKLGSDPSDTNAFAASTFFACDRYISFRCDWGKDYKDPDSVLIANRYTTANAVHQLSKLPRNEWDAFLDWLFDFEYGKLGLPAPDKVFFLKLDPTVSISLVDKRSHADNRKKDIHEKSEDFLFRSYEAAVYAARKMHWQTVVCDREGVLRDREDIHKEILQSSLHCISGV